jgi:hypothetical protein
MDAVTGKGSQGSGQGQGVLGNPGLLAAGAAGFAAAFCALWAFRGLPLGAALLWVTPVPLFLAGLGFGAGSAIAAAGLASLLVAVVGGGIPLIAFLLLFGVPAPLLVATALRPEGRLDLSLPLALIGIWPVVVLLAAALFFSGEGGLEAAMRRGVEGTLGRMGLPAGEDFIGTMVRVKAAAVGFWAGLALIVNAAAAQSFLARRGLARAPSPDWAAVRLPRWYPALPGAALLLLLVAPAEADTVPLSALLLLLLPLFYLGLAGVHARARGHRAKVPILVTFYLLLLLFLQLMAPALVGLGLFDHFRRPGGSPPAAPPQT